MKKWGIILLCCLLLSGCAGRETLETVDDGDVQPVVQMQRQMLLQVDEEADVLEGETGVAYLCDGYTVTAEALPAGNLGETFAQVTGFGMDELTVMETSVSDFTRYECAWTAMGEEGQTIGRAVIVDDGIYHYCVTVMADAADTDTCRQEMDEILDSFMIQ